MDDGKIVELFLMRDESAISHAGEKYGRRLRSLAHGITGDMQTAEECENDTYRQAWDLIPPNTPHDYLYAFLARLTRNIAIDRCRNRSRLKRSAYILELSAEMEQCIPAPSDMECLADSMVLREALNGFLAALDVEKRNVFIRRYWYLDPVAAIAKRFGISESKVKTTLYRSRERLREHLEREGYKL